MSGSLDDDETPLQTARREIQEEVGYRPDEVALLGAGVPFEVFESERDLTWRVHPFLWWVKSEEAPHLDWENSEHRWVPLDRAPQLDTVPLLWDAADGLLPPLGDAVLHDARSIRNDRISGASQLQQRLAEVTRDLPIRCTTWPQLLLAAWWLGSSRPAMAALGGFVRQWLRQVSPSEASQDFASYSSRRNKEPSTPWRAPLLDDDRERLARAHHVTWERSRTSAVRLADRGAQVVARAQRVVLFSYSSSCLTALRVAIAAGHRPEVVCASSRPGGEGARVHGALSAAGLNARLVPDSALFLELAAADLLLLGADAVFPDGSIVNKVGTAAAALAARHHGVPVVVLADEFKRVAPFDPLDLERVGGDGGEQSVPLFERVPAGSIDHIVGPDGDWTFAAPSLPLRGP